MRQFYVVGEKAFSAGTVRFSDQSGWKSGIVTVSKYLSRARGILCGLGSLCTLTAAAVSSLLSAYGFIDDHSVYMHSPATATASAAAEGNNVPTVPL